MTNDQRPITNLQSLILNPYSVLPTLALLAIILVATFLRFYQLPVLPPGLNFDEAGNGVAALDILQGNPKLWWRIGGGKEPFWPYLIALSTAVLGNIPLALRLPAAFTGILNVAAVYPLARRLFRGSDPQSRRNGQMIAVLTVLGLALSGWHLHFSRLGFRAILLPLLSTLGFYFFWRSIVRRQVSGVRFYVSRITHRIPRMPVLSQAEGAHHTPPINLILSSLFLALAIYAYLAARLLPLVLIVFFTLDWLIYRLYIWRSPTSEHETRRHSSFIIYIFAFLLLFLSPLVLYFALNPADFAARSATVSIFNPDWNQGNLIGAAWHTLTLTLSTFIGLAGDANPLVNLPGWPALPAILVPFFILGLIVSLYRIIHPCPLALLLPRSPAPSSSYLFILTWWTIMLLPALLAPEGAPHHLRLIGTLVPTYVIVAIGLTAATNFLAKILTRAIRTQSAQYASRITHHASRSAYLLPATCYLLLAIQTCTSYFIRWPASVDFTLPFDLYAVRLAEEIAAASPNAGYVLPMDIRAGPEARHYTLDYLLATRRSSPYTYLPVDERNAETLLAQAAEDKDELRVVRWKADKHREADAKEIVTYLLETTAHRRGREPFPVYDVETYVLPNRSDFNLDSQCGRTVDCSPRPAVTFTLPTIDQPIGAVFEGLLRVDAAYVQPATSPGGWLPVALTLSPLAPMNVDYKASLRLVAPTGERVAQKDRTLLHTYHQGTSLWPPETVNEYYLLPIPPETQPGEYAVVVVIYHPDTLAPLVAGGLVEVPIGMVMVE